MNKTDKIFTSSLKRGELGEEIFLSSFAGMRAVKAVYDARHSAKYQDMDIDFLIDLKQKNEPSGLAALAGSTRVSVELKTDYTIHPNLYYEKYSCYELQTAGCMEKTKSDVLIYYYIKKNVFYVLKTDSFRDWVHAHGKEFKKNFRQELGRAGIYHKGGLLVPTSMIEAALKAKEIIGEKVRVGNTFSKKRVALLDASSYAKIEILHDERKVKNFFDDMDI